jgi:hypothetical protein
MHRDPHEIHRVLHHPERADRAPEHRRVGDVEREALVAQRASGPLRFADSLLGEIDVGPAGEAIFPVPDAFAVTQKNELFHVSNCR